MSRLGWASPLLYVPSGWVRAEPDDMFEGGFVSALTGRSGATGGLFGGGAGFVRGHGPEFHGGGASARWTNAVRPKINRTSREAMGVAVIDAERRSGLQVALCIGPTKAKEDPHAHALDIFFELGIQEARSLLVYVAPNIAAAEIVTSIGAGVPDERCTAALEAMVLALETGDVARAVPDGLGVLLP